MIFELMDGERTAIEPVGPQQAFMTLVRHSYVLALLAATGAAQSHFRQTVSVAASVPINKLVRQRNLADIGLVAELVENYVAGRSYFHFNSQAAPELRFGRDTRGHPCNPSRPLQ